VDGWVKLHRELLKKSIWLMSTPQQKTILITLLLMANHDENKWEWKGEPYSCKPGQFVTSLENIANECGKGISVQNVRTALKRFEKYEFLTDKSTKTGRLITIVNWSNYQITADDTNKVGNSLLTGNQQTANRQLTPNKKEKNDKNIKNKIYSDIPELNTALIEFIEFRKKIKAPMTDRAIELLKGNLNKLNNSIPVQIAILDQSIMNGWKGVFELKQDKIQSQQQPKQSTNKFNQFPQRTYTDNDYAELERKLINKGL
jgi:hypothetical protein